MARPKIEISEDVKAKRADRLKTVIEEQTRGNQTAFAKAIPISQQTISCIIHKKSNLTDSLAELIVNKYPMYSATWLLGYDDYKNEEERIMDSFIQGYHDKRDWIVAVDTLISIAQEKNDCKEAFDNGINSFNDIVSLRKEITDFVEFKVLRIAEEGRKNG